MAITRAKKESILKDLSEQFKKARLVVFVNFHGLNTAASRELRKLMRASSAKYLVAKKTLIKKALEKFKFSGPMPNLEGEIGLIFETAEKEIINLAKNLVKFIKEHKELSVVGGIMESGFAEPKIISDLAAIPSREVLLYKLVNIINSPLQRLVGALNGPIRDFTSVLDQINKNKS